MDFSKYEIVPLSVDHITPVTLLWREAMSAAIGIAPIHSFESQAYFLEHIIAQSQLPLSPARRKRSISFMLMLRTKG